MRRRKLHCPRPECRSQAYVKSGYFKTKWNGQPVPRYRCKECRKNFSTHTFRETFGQHRPDINDMVFKLFASGVTQRRMAEVLDVNRKTIVRKFRFLGRLAKHGQLARLREHGKSVAHIQFDEMETFEHTKLKPLTIALAVNGETGEPLAFRIEQMGYKGPLAGLALAKYGPRAHRAPNAVRRTLELARHYAANAGVIASDEHPSYPPLVAKQLPHFTHHATKRVPNTVGKRRRNLHDPHFRLNVMCSILRKDLSRLSRKTWTTTKKSSRLQTHLDIYFAWFNGIDLVA